ncbi:MAG: AMP-binding protein [bacterium]|nr:AMP-binding protein [bacterium]
MDLLQKERPVMVNLVPTVYQSMLSLPGIEQIDFSFVGRFTTSGAPMPPEVMRSCERVFGIRFGKGYGLTEAAPAVSSLTPDEYALDGDPLLVKRSHSVGKPLPNVSVAIRREDGTECGTDEHGEITVSGQNVMLGYWNDPERTREALRDGWLFTGDIGYKDEEGYLYLVDRKGDMIISGGENVHPTETENTLQEHPAVREVAVVGVPDPKWGEAVKAVVALEPGYEVTVEELIAFCKERLAGYKCPRSIDFVDELPKSTVGKILRREVRNRYSANESDNSEIGATHA